MNRAELVRHTVFQAYEALGFRCSACGALKPKQGLHVVHKQGLEAHRKLVAMLPDYLKLVVTSPDIRSLYTLLCKDCRASHDSKLAR